MHAREHIATSAGLAALTMASWVCADVTVFGSLPTWEAQAGPNVTHVTFEGLGQGYFTNQYASLGLTDPEQNDFVDFTVNPWTDHSILGGYNPLVGLTQPSSITLDLDSPIFAVGFKYVLGPKIDLFLGATPVAMNVQLPTYSQSQDGYKVFDFAGISSAVAFDRVVMKPGTGMLSVDLDDFWFQSVPAPGGVALLALGALVQQRRTQRHSERR